MSASDDPRLGTLHGPACSCGHNACESSNYAEQNREDPTRTKTARNDFASHLRGRWDAIKFHINRGIVENDALGLGGPDIGSLEEADGDFAVQVDTNNDLTPGTGQFDFPSDADVAAEFDEWLDEVFEGEILEAYDGDRYIRKGYGRGIDHADTELRQVGVDVPDQEISTTLRLPVHENKLALLQERAFEELEGIGDAAAQDIRRELTEGLAQGDGPRDIARNINDRVEKVGKTRSTVMARTEVIRSHSEASLDRYESIAGDVDITIRAEFTTSTDNNVCDQCAALEGRVYTTKEARGLIPVHPQCRCALIPVGDSATTNAAQIAAQRADKRDVYSCNECDIPLAEDRSRCIHCDLEAGDDLPVVDLREVAS